MDSTELNQKLVEFSKEILPGDDFFTNGKEIADKIFRILQRDLKSFSFDRFRIVGSVGKKTLAVCVDPDFDLVVFVNEEKPYFERVLAGIELVLTTSDLEVKGIEKTRHSVQFTVNGISFDLLPAANFVTQYPKPRDPELGKIQWQKTMEFIRRNPSQGYKYGSSVCEIASQFMKDQSSFVHDVARLSKFWNKTLHIDCNISGRSTLIELIGVYAGRKEEQTGRRSLLEGFKSFLQLMTNFRKIEIVFLENYGRHDIPKDVQGQRPLVLDPANQFNNFAKFNKKDNELIIRKFEAFAKETLSRLNGISSSPLFEVQPKYILPENVEFRKPNKWLVGVQHIYKKHPEMVVRMSDKHFKEHTFIAKSIQQCLLTTATTLSLRGIRDSTEIKNAAKKCVDESITGNNIEWVPASSDTHESRSITLYIPISGDTNRCIVASHDFE
jgi:hypothetical protein